MRAREENEPGFENQDRVLPGGKGAETEATVDSGALVQMARPRRLQ